jgi:hypothetical protein
MKQKTGTALGVVFLLLALGTVVQAEESRKISFRVETGDTFTNLFGSDWQKAYQQNQLTVFREGKPVTSPDLLIEGMIVRVSLDVGLTPRAVARCGELRARRDRLAARVATLEQQGGENVEAKAAVLQARRLLGDDLRFAADVDFAARQVEYLETLVNRPATPLPELRASAAPYALSGWRPYLVTGLLVTAMFAAALYIASRAARPRYPEADARYHEVIADLKTSLNSAGLKL